MSAGVLALAGKVGQADAGVLAQGALELVGGLWGGVEWLGECYADCDGSGGTPRLTANDFTCFVNRFTAGDMWANCDGSTTFPILNINDFVCYINRFAVGCS